MKFLKLPHLILLVLIALCACKQPYLDTWEITIPGVTTSSSPQAADLNADGIMDIVIGAGAEEWHSSAASIIALNGANGKILWLGQARNQIVGSAVFEDINADAIPDVFIGGRSAELQALDGRTGHIIWQFFETDGAMKAHDKGWYNFFNPQFVKDQDGDGIRDIIICNGGDATLAAGSKYRPAGNLMLLSGATGAILAQDQMPDGAETYFSPVLIDDIAGPNPGIVFGSGGETQKGHLYYCKLNQLKSRNLRACVTIDSSSTKGFIAPPVLADFTKDGKLDIQINTAEGGIKLFDGNTFKKIWEVQVKGAEIYSQAGVGQFTGAADIPDVFVNVAYGSYPIYTKVERWLIDGQDGSLVKKYAEKRFNYCSPLVADLNGDQTMEALQSTVKDSLKGTLQIPYNDILAYNFVDGSVSSFGKRLSGAAFAATPLLKDLNKDGLAELVYSSSPAVISEFPGITTFQKPVLSLTIRKMPTKIPVKKVGWGAYMNGGQSISK